MKAAGAKASWDIFCNVVDNFGDVGVTWRLARQLVAEHQLDVRLWIDDLGAFARLCPDADPLADQQWQAGVNVCRWPAPWQDTPLPDVVLEAFACRLPEAYIEAMLRSSPRPVWLNLDYLSAEDWVAGCHGLPSMQSNGLKKTFFFPGFEPGTGGLLRERDLLERRRALQGDAAARREALQAFGVRPAGDARLISLFAYENPGLGSWLDTLEEAERPTHVLVPEGRVLGDVQAWLGMQALAAGAVQVRGALTVQVLPFVRQEQYDTLLWSCDFNVVRGEDSFVRAQWAARPMLWHIYQQEDQAHLPKLEAFLQLYAAGLSPAAARDLRQCWLAWNAGGDLKTAWHALDAHWPELERHAQDWCRQQAAQTDLATALVQFCRN
ncbi:elongation factor P maturation arginine rhamnosyltransferase EarP [Pseudomonas sp. v388]|uniref:elongation factor P maturation arginine rhamnosyltransferase EarP n=1 Tax=Pseudomonas sp. v388 TaxID=2479849 RepID=UPI000F79D84C|nr:elongation factor P maturation arginine rhamnosyltransferase EarP [Pseudomonas sp. v388]RRV06997.1 elongation factor P maturation arginine rhamnosyltransferase EarP [Pseudomonas sp. v388]